MKRYETMSKQEIMNMIDISAYGDCRDCPVFSRCNKDTPSCSENLITYLNEYITDTVPRIATINTAERFHEAQADFALYCYRTRKESGCIHCKYKDDILRETGKTHACFLKYLEEEVEAKS